MDSTAPTDKRNRKQTAFFEVKAAATPKQVIVSDGMGIKLAENPLFCQELDKVKGDSEVCKALHLLLFNSVGKRAEIKKNLRTFSGFASTGVRDERKLKMLEKKKVWTVSLLKTVLGMVGLEKGGDRDVLVNRVIEYFASPSFTKEARDTTVPKKRKSSSGSKVGKESKKAKKTDRPKKAPSAYLLFCSERRPIVRADNPELSMIELTKLMAAEWNELAQSGKERFVEEAQRAKLALAASGAATTTDDIDFGSDDDDAADEGDEEGSEQGDSEGEATGDDGAEDDFKDLQDSDAEE